MIYVVIAAILVARVSGLTAAEICAMGGITASAFTLRQQHRCGALTPSQRARSLVLLLTALDCQGRAMRQPPNCPLGGSANQH